MKTPTISAQASVVRLRASLHNVVAAALVERIEAVRKQAQVERARAQMYAMQEQHGWKQ